MKSAVRDQLMEERVIPALQSVVPVLPDGVEVVVQFLIKPGLAIENLQDFHGSVVLLTVTSAVAQVRYAYRLKIVDGNYCVFNSLPFLHSFETIASARYLPNWSGSSLTTASR